MDRNLLKVIDLLHKFIEFHINAPGLADLQEMKQTLNDLKEEILNPPTQPLPTLEEYNIKREQLREKLMNYSPRGAEVLCSECKVEMILPTPDITYACYPPKKDVECPQCKKRSYIIS